MNARNAKSRQKCNSYEAARTLEYYREFPEKLAELVAVVDSFVDEEVLCAKGKDVVFLLAGIYYESKMFKPLEITDGTEK